MEEKFKDVLETDETIVEIIKPIKKRYWRQLAVPFAIPLLWPHFLILLVLSLFTLPYFIAKGYNNLFYAYTNKRLLIRSGIFGTTFHSLDYKDITATTIQVGFLDRNLNTGSLKFSNPSVHAGKPFSFLFIEKPYEKMRAIKEYISSVKD